MTISESRKKANAKWNKNHLWTISCIVDKETAQKFKTACENRGTSMNAVLKDYVKLYASWYAEI